jgi:hypothetical protein
MPDDSRFCPRCGLPKLLPDETSTGTRRFASAEEVGHLQANRSDSVVAVGKAASADSPAQAASRPGNLPAAASGSVEPLSNDAVHALLTRANLSRVRGDWTDATDRCVTVLRAQPGNATAHALLGDIYRDQGKLDDAIQWYRMAVDLRPNPSDEAKLRQTERERAKLFLTSNGPAAANSRRLPLGLDGGLLTGTANLLGLSPRRWLRWITVVSVVFLAGMILVLLTLQGRHPAVSAVPQPVATMPPAVPAGGTQNLLPPPNTQAIRHAPGTEPSEPPVSAAGSGLAPDAPGSSAPASPSKPPSSHDSSSPNKSDDSTDLPVAPINAVIPMGWANGAALFDFGSSQWAMENIALEGDMLVAQVQKDDSEGHAIIYVLASASHYARDPLVRNAYRAARAVFRNDSSLTRITILIQPDPRTTSDTTPLLYAELDRFAAEQVDPEKDSVDRLISYLRFLPLPGQGSLPSQTPGNPQNMLSLSSASGL